MEMYSIFQYLKKINQLALHVMNSIFKGNMYFQSQCKQGKLNGSPFLPWEKKGNRDFIYHNYIFISCKSEHINLEKC